MKDIPGIHDERNEGIEYIDHTPNAVPVRVQASRFLTADGVVEYHLLLEPGEDANMSTQLDWLLAAYRSALTALGLTSHSAILRRFFCSDVADPGSIIGKHPFCQCDDAGESCAISIIAQPPTPPAKVALWAYHASVPGGEPDEEPDKRLEDTTLIWQHNGLSHHWTAGLSCSQAESSYDQTRELLHRYEALLHAHGLSPADNVVRTWLFVRDIDKNYAGLVDARREFFLPRGLTPETHFIASTGIEGHGTDHNSLVTLDAYAIGGLQREQVSFLSAPEHLGPTHLYGVTFERGTTVAYRDRKHVFISGTASIGQQGELLHPGDLSGQLHRTLANIDALLQQAGAGFQHINVMIAYVRNPSDQPIVEQQLFDSYENIPIIVLVAPVCRPGWLVEVECQATITAKNPTLPAL